MVVPLARYCAILASIAAAVLTFGGRPGVLLAQSPAAGPQDLNLVTKDGVQLRATYYPSNAGERAVPIVMLHDFNETRAVFAPLARALSTAPRNADRSKAPTNEARAVITVDLRGHGESKTAIQRDGTPVEIDAKNFGVADYQDMVLYDMEAVRAFLVEQNDAGRLNLNKLCLMGAGMGANVAVLAAAKDWATPPLPVRKQGQDVKALILLSPRWNFRGLELNRPLKFPPIQRDLSVYLAYGEDDPQVTKDCDNILKILTRYHPEPPPDRVAQEKDLFWYAPATRLQGSQLLTNSQFALAPKLADFIEARLGRRQFPYVSRKK